MRKLYTLICTYFFLLHFCFAQQTVQLYYEDFNSVNNTFGLNAATSLGTNSGNNQWVINNNYNGAAVYPNTPDEFQTVSGTIAGAPYSNYLHITDVNTAAAMNDNYDPNSQSDRMAVMNTGFCTLAMTDVTMTFFYIAEGNASDYGSMYYSIDGGATWIQTGQAQYNNQSLWKYEIVMDPAFNNQIDLRFAWRWVNSTGATQSVSFGIDDIIVVGTYDNVNNPVTIDITSVVPNPVCQGGYMSIFFTLSQPLCDGTYQVEMSNASGNFSSPYNLGVFTVYANQTSGGVTVVIPSNAPPGGCYEVRIDRVSPPPVITGTASICFTIQVCPNTITTLQPVVTFGPDTVCVHSVIDVPFYSTGVYNANNQYIAELSDQFGSFAAPLVIGSVADPNTYDPTLGSPPGTVSGLVPTTPPGCGYYIRVRSTSPGVIPPPPNYFGPFCIRDCDVTTNQMQDISVCISDNVGVDTTITIDIGTWNNNTTYLPGNQFEAQVINSQTYQIINTGSLGSVVATTSTTMTLSIPGLLQLIPILGPPGVGMYYLRIVATNPNPAWSNYGTLIHLTIGSPDSLPPLITPSDTLVCQGDILSITINPYNAYTNGSKYQWYSPNLNNGVAFYWNYNPLLISFAGAPAGTYWFTVREFNYGCWGPWADTVYVDVIAPPYVGIIGPSPVCTGDTVVYHVPFLAGTYYQWTLSSGIMIDTSNNEITVVFDSAGTAQLGIFALNMCGSGNGFKNVIVNQSPTVTAPNDTSICPGSSITLNANSNATTNAWSTLGGSVFSNSNPTNVNPSDTTTYIIVGTGTAGCKDEDTCVVYTLIPPVVAATTQDVSCYGDADGTATATGSSGVGPYQYSWDSNPVQGTATATGLAGGGYSVVVTDAQGCKDTSFVLVNEPSDILLTANVTAVTFYNANDGTATVTASGGTPPYTYVWNTVPQQTGATATGLGPGTYDCTVTDSSGCTRMAEVTIANATNMLTIPNAFTPNGDGLNDQFLLYSTNVSAFDIKIFNRWGQMLYESTDLTTGWDGTYQGKQEEMGVYIYYIKVTYFDGGTDERKGNVTLMR